MKYLSADTNDMNSLITSHHGVPSEFIQQGTTLKYAQNTSMNTTDKRELRVDTHTLFQPFLNKSMKNETISSDLRLKPTRDPKSKLQTDPFFFERRLPIYGEGMESAIPFYQYDPVSSRVTSTTYSKR